MGNITSEGMLLASSIIKDDGSEIVSLLLPDKDMPNGSDIF
jgi:hypothetical protein